MHAFSPRAACACCKAVSWRRSALGVASDVSVYTDPDVTPSDGRSRVPVGVFAASVVHQPIHQPAQTCLDTHRQEQRKRRGLWGWRRHEQTATDG